MKFLTELFLRKYYMDVFATCFCSAREMTPDMNNQSSCYLSLVPCQGPLYTINIELATIPRRCCTFLRFWIFAYAGTPAGNAFSCIENVQAIFLTTVKKSLFWSISPLQLECRFLVWVSMYSVQTLIIQILTWKSQLFAQFSY